MWISYKLEKWMNLKDFIITKCWLAQAIDAFEWLKKVCEPSGVFWGKVTSTLNCPDKYLYELYKPLPRLFSEDTFRRATIRYIFIWDDIVTDMLEIKLDLHVYMNQCLQHAHRSNFTSSRGKGNNDRLSLMWPIFYKTTTHDNATYRISILSY